MAIITTQSAAQDVVSSLVHALFNQANEEYSATLEYPEWGFIDHEVQVPDEKLQGLAGPGRAVLTIEGEQYGSNERYRDYPISFTLRKYTSELEVTEESQHWLLKAGERMTVREISSFVDDAVQALNLPIDEDAARMFYLGFGTTFFTGGDGLSLYSGSHTIRKPGSGTQSNLFSDTHRAFSPANLVEAVNLMNRFKTMANIQMRPCRRIRVLCSLENGPVVDKAISSEYGPETPNLGLSSASKSSFARRGVTVDYRVVSKMPYAYKDYWFVIDMERASKRLFMGWGWKPRLNDHPDFRKGTYFNDGSTLVGPTALGWQFTLGSKGDGSAV